MRYMSSSWVTPITYNAEVNAFEGNDASVVRRLNDVAKEEEVCDEDGALAVMQHEFPQAYLAEADRGEGAESDDELDPPSAGQRDDDDEDEIVDDEDEEL